MACGFLHDFTACSLAPLDWKRPRLARFIGCGVGWSMRSVMAHALARLRPRFSGGIG
jgi:hypothetical protein